MAPTAAKKDDKPKGLVFLYLLAYNFTLASGWLYVLIQTAQHYANNGTYTTVYPKVEFQLKIWQTAALLEIFHSLFRFVKSPIQTTLMQVASRIYLLWAIVYNFPEAQQSVSFTSMVVCWSVTEVIRYLYYGLNLLDAVPYFLTYLRYTLFIVLYPAGVSSELACIWFARPAMLAAGHWALALPNKFNIEFSHHFLTYIVYLTYVPGFPQLYTYMWGQRRKLLAGDKATDKANKSL
eukprot:TRINITY_DN3838_c0_g1_i1.p1 TRINITY_DN3838_c0_g1~~TRINITY_DN3838_c0_g1_i1.p1  ORF type:complete len:236 (-),score=43.62 TRINITY_DN3838_c0_g1_i1:156-863(-)